MKLFVEEKTADLLGKVSNFITRQNINGYIVGGYVRDALLGRPTRDIDIAIPEALEIAKKLAKALDGKFIALDKSNGVARVVLVDYTLGSRWSLDFSTIEGDIESNLSHRDFTIDAMAINLREMDRACFIDPFQGQQDLERGLIQVVGETAFQDDPLRLLRAARLSAEYGFTISEKTENLIQAQSQLIRHVAGERVKEELCRLLSTSKSATFLYYLDRLSLLTAIFPELTPTKGVEQPWEHFWDVFQHSIETVAGVESLLEAKEIEQDQVLSLAPRSSAFIQHFNEEIGSGVTRGILLKLAALLHDIAKPQTKSIEPNGRARFLGHTKEGAVVAGNILQRLRFSTRETRIIQKMIESHLRLWQMGSNGKPTHRAIYRFFRDTEGISIDIMFLTLADFLATQGPNLDLAQWRQHCQMMEYIWSEHVKEEARIVPSKLIDGHDLINIFGLEPGPKIGEILERVHEAQGIGEITTREEALSFARMQLAQTQATDQITTGEEEPAFVPED